MQSKCLKIYGLKRIVFIIVICLIFQISGVSSTYAAQNTEASSNLDVVFVLDASQSLLKTDNTRIREEAIKLFIDMLHTQGDRAALAAFSGNIVKQSELLSLDSSQEKQGFKDLITNIPLGEWTDIGLGLKTGVDILDKEHDNSKKPLIIFLSDGKNEPDPKNDKNLSEVSLNAAIEEAKNKNYPIYTIGLNTNGQVDKALIENVASQTAGKSYIAKDASELPSIINEIYGIGMDNSFSVKDESKGSGSFEDHKINISYTGMAEANISIISDSQIEVKIADPNGKEYTASTENVIISKSEGYTAVKLINPAKGDWTVKVKGEPNQDIRIDTIINSEFKVGTDLKQNTKVHKGETVKLGVFLEGSSGKIEDEELYKAVKGKLLVKKLSDNSTVEINLTYKDKLLQGEYPVKDRGEYEFKAIVSGTGFSAETQAIKVTAENRPPVTVGKPEKLKLAPDGQEKVIYLSQYFKDEDGDEITYSIKEGAGEVASAALSGNELKITPKNKGTASIVIAADDKNGGNATQTIELKVNSKIFQFLSEMYMIFILGAIIIISAIFLIKNEIRLRTFR